MDIISLNSLLISTQRMNRIGHDQQIKSSSLYQQRKESGFYEEMAKTNPHTASMQEQIDRWNADTGTLPERLSGQKPSESSALITKFTSGQELSYDELQELRRTNPQMYAKAVQVAAERKAYEKELRNCKTKEDVQRVRMNRLASVVEQSRRDPVMALARANAISRATAVFMKSSQYGKLPTESEKAETQKRERTEREHAAQPKEAAENAEEIKHNRPVQTDERPAETENSDRTEIELPETGDIAFPSVDGKTVDRPNMPDATPKINASSHNVSSDAEYAHSVYKKMSKPK